LSLAGVINNPLKNQDAKPNLLGYNEKSLPKKEAFILKK